MERRWTPAYEPVCPRTDPPARKAFCTDRYRSYITVEFDRFTRMNSFEDYGTNSPIRVQAQLEHNPLEAQEYIGKAMYADAIRHQLQRMVMRELEKTIFQGA